MITITGRSLIRPNGEVREWLTELKLENGKSISTINEVRCYIELKNRLIILVNWFNAKYYERIDPNSNYSPALPEEELERNIFCYDKQTGEQLWQVEGCGDSVYTGMGIDIQQEDGSYIPGGIRAGEWGQVQSITYLDKEFRKGIDRLEVGTFSCHEYALDIDTGKVTFLRQGK